MTDQAFTIVVDETIHAALIADAADAHTSPEKLVGELLRERYTDHPGDPQHDAWFLREIEAAVREADDPNTEWVSNEVVMEESRRQIERLLARAGKKAA